MKYVSLLFRPINKGTYILIVTAHSNSPLLDSRRTAWYIYIKNNSFIFVLICIEHVILARQIFLLNSYCNLSNCLRGIISKLSTKGLCRFIICTTESNRSFCVPDLHALVKHTDSFC